MPAPAHHLLFIEPHVIERGTSELVRVEPLNLFPQSIVGAGIVERDVWHVLNDYLLDFCGYLSIRRYRSRSLPAGTTHPISDPLCQRKVSQLPRCDYRAKGEEEHRLVPSR